MMEGMPCLPRQSRHWRRRPRAHIPLRANSCLQWSPIALQKVLFSGIRAGAMMGGQSAGGGGWAQRYARRSAPSPLGRRKSSRHACRSSSCWKKVTGADPNTTGQENQIQGESQQCADSGGGCWPPRGLTR